MKVGTLTFTHTSNYGAILQAYALQTVFLENGVDCEIIDYFNPTVYKNHNPRGVWKRPGVKNKVVAPLMYLVYRKRLKKFLAFEKQYCIFSPQRYTRSTVFKTAERYDRMVVGSDQVWNLKITDGDMTYFLDYLSDEHQKCSYAASIGSIYFDDKDKEKCEKLLKHFRNISMRESQALERMQNQIGKQASCDLDPTLLLTKDRWETMIKRKPQTKDYILMYLVPEEEALFRSVTAFAREIDCEVILIKKGIKGHRGMKIKNTLSPEEFLNYVYYARYVIAGSFHGVCFSVLFQKNFYATSSIEKKLSGRVISLLENLGLEQRFVGDDYHFKDENIAYETVCKRLDKLRNQSRNTIKRICE